MIQAVITMDQALYDFYQEIGQAAGGQSPEVIMAETLRWLAEELSRGVAPAP